MATRDAPEEGFFAAGAPWYLTLFGRDSIWAARMVLPIDLGPARGTLRTLARRQGARHEDAEDVVQEIFIDIWRNAERFDPEVAAEPTYITLIARRRLIDHYRRQHRDLDTTSIAEEGIPATEDHDCMERTAATVQLASASVEPMPEAVRERIRASGVRYVSTSWGM